MADEL